MKRTTLLISLIALVSLFSKGEIKVDLWGLTLGESTKEQVAEAMKGSHYEFDDISDGGYLFGPVVKDGVEWEGAAFLFNWEGEKLSAVVFMNPSNDATLPSYRALIDKVSKEYKGYLIDLCINGDENYYIYEDENGVNLEFEESKTKEKLYMLYSLIGDEVEDVTMSDPADE